MSDFCFSNEDRQELLSILRVINPLTQNAYGPLLDSWGMLARISPSLASRSTLADICKTINPVVAMAYGPLLDAWANKPPNRIVLAQILRTVNPLTAAAYGPLLDAWANKRLEAVRVRGRTR